jgi:signal transduction histidine kinase
MSDPLDEPAGVSQYLTTPITRREGGRCSMRVVGRCRMVPRARFLAALGFALATVASPSSAWADERQRQVLVMYSTRRDAQIVVVGDRELPRILEGGLQQGVDYYSEFIDATRFAHSDYRAANRDFLRLKYTQHTFDLIIAMDDLATELAVESRRDLFRETPIVFFSDHPSPRPPNSTGLIAELNLGATLALATTLQPDTQHVFVVNGSEDRYLEVARRQFRTFEPRLSITYLTRLPTNELEARLAALPAHSIVYYLIVGRDGANENYNPLDYLDRIAAVSAAPIYCWVDSSMNHGIVGGSLKSQVAEIRAVGQLAVRVLRGERPDSIPVSTADFNVSQVDWRQLRGWGISEARVPAGTTILFREPTAWERYRIYIVGATVLVLAQAALIVGLIVQRATRQRAEAKLHASQTKLIASYDRIRDLGRRLLTAQEAERARIARELHDDIGQQMAIVTADLELLGRDGPARLDGGRLVVETLDRARLVGKSLRAVSHRLHPANLRLIGLVPALGGLQRELSSTETRIAFTHDDVPPALPQDVSLCLFRVAQEGLQNAIKHSGARDISVRLRAGGDSLVLMIDDDGTGFDVEAAPPGLGLISIAERVEQVGGTLQVRSMPGGGTHVEVSVPLRTEPSMKSVAV